MGNSVKNTVFTAVFEDITNEGFGVCRAPDGRATFVPQALPGETALVRIIKEYKSYLIGRMERLVTASPDRIEPDCAVFTRCGGCTYRHISYEAELELKRKSVEALFKRNAGMELSVPTPLHGKPDGYRNKLLLPFAERDGVLYCGFYAKHSHTVVPCERCLLHSDDFGAVASRLVALLQGNSAYDEATGKGLLRHLYIRRTVGGDFGVCLIINGKQLPNGKTIAETLMRDIPAVKSFYININTARTNTVNGKQWQCLSGEETLTDTLCGKRFVLSPAAFFQVNPQMTEVLYSAAAALADIQSGDTVFDLYCGAGTVGLCVCPDGARLCGVEIVPQAVENAVKNAELNGRSAENTRFICGDAAVGFAECRKAFGKKASVVLVDPPRAGLDAALTEAIAAEAPERVVYISCNPATLARDVLRFSENGYSLSSLVTVDMFPRTAHVECVACLTRRLDDELRRRA